MTDKHSPLGFHWMLDTSFFPVARSPERERLVALHETGRIKLAETDVLDTELTNARPDIRAVFEIEAAKFSEYLGPLVLDHSRLGHAVLGSKLDQSLLDEVVGLLFPGKTSLKAKPHDVRDAMHIAWAKRYGFDGFITEDQRLLRKKAVLKARLSFDILSPVEALT